jgi:Amidohydrolase family
MFVKRLAAALLCSAAFLVSDANAQNLVIQGGTLIDGTGRTPIENAVIVIENGRFKAIGRRGEVQVPAGVQFVDASGKHILPGFIDGHCHWETFWAEVYLHLGITTCVQIETHQNGPWGLAQRDGTAAGHIRGPRIWPSGVAIGTRQGLLDTEGSRAWRSYISVPNEEAARAVVRQKKQDGYDILKISEFLTPALVAVIVDEAHKLGLGVTGHSWDVVGYSKAGIDGIEHIWSVGYSSIMDLERRHRLATARTAGKIDAEIAGAQYEVQGFDEVIRAMVENRVAWTPTIAKWLRPLSPSAQRFWQREQEILASPNARFPDAVRVITEFTTEKLFERYRPEQLEQARIGYQKANEFIRRFVAAGGILKEGSDPPRGMAGMTLHQGLVMDVEAGVPPMVAIQAATINVARTFKKDRDYGSVEPGKVADLFLVEGNPLQDIWMTQNVKLLVMNGRIVNHQFTGYVNPIPEFNSWQQLSQTIHVLPEAVTQGTSVRLKVSGRGFWPFHRVLLNGRELETRFVNRSELQATLPGDAIQNVGMYKVTVRSTGEAVPESNPAPLVVRFKQ